MWDDAASESKWHIFKWVYFICNLTEKSLIPILKNAEYIETPDNQAGR